MIAGDVSGLHVGLAMGAASMISIGPNNLMLLREGLTGGRNLTVATLVLASYVILVGAAVLLAASSFQVDHGLRSAFSWGGLLAVSWFAVMSFRAAACHQTTAGTLMGRETLCQCVRRVLRVVWANPLTWVELLFIPTALAQSFGTDADRLEFAGALLGMSALCCFGYALCGGLLASLLRRRANLRLFDLASGLILSGVSVSIGSSLLFGAG